MPITPLLFLFLSLARLVNGTSSPTCPQLDGAPPRSIWSILGRCALTLLICVWHAVHPDIPGHNSHGDGHCARAPWVFFTSLFAPELVVGYAAEERFLAYTQVEAFRERGYEWSMAHAHFARMGGFVYSDERGLKRTIDADEFLELCEAKKIANPFLTEKDIRGRSRSDVPGKTIFCLQLFWFMLQAVVRGSSGLAVTLVELDTAAMATLAVAYLLLWWNKPLRARTPHVFVWSPAEKTYSASELCTYPLYNLTPHIRKTRPVVDNEKAHLERDDSKPKKATSWIRRLDAIDAMRYTLSVSWAILGLLHLVAWNFEFPTEKERHVWRVASVLLTGSSVAFVGVLLLVQVLAWAKVAGALGRTCAYAIVLLMMLGIVTRMILAGLMLASLRALPCSAYQSISWTAYIPHL